MGKFTEGVKGLFSRKQPRDNRPQWPSSSSYAEPSWRESWEDRKEAPPAYSSHHPASSAISPVSSSANPAPYSTNQDSSSKMPGIFPRVRGPPKEIPDHLVKYSHAEDKYAFLTYFDTIFVIDDSGSMKGKLWKEAADVLRAITPICTSHDKDGIDLYFLNHRSRNRAPAGKGPHGYYGIDRPQEITALFNSVYPHSGTPTGITLSNILSPYVRRCSADGVENVKPINIIVITDGVASDDPDSIIAQFVGELDRLNAPPHQVGIQFFQVGEDKDAGDDLKMLDDLFGSESGTRDMVDSVTWDEQEHDRKLDPTLPKTLSGDTILKIVLGAVIRRLDKLPTQRPTT